MNARNLKIQHRRKNSIKKCIVKDKWWLLDMVKCILVNVKVYPIKSSNLLRAFKTILVGVFGQIVSYVHFLSMKIDKYSSKAM